MELEEVKKLSIDLIESTTAVLLSTIDPNGYPITRALLNVRNKKRYPEFIDFFDKQKNKFITFFSTGTFSSKIEHFKKNPKICVYFCEEGDFKGLMLGGDIEIVQDLDVKNEFFLESSYRYYPKGIEDPNYTILQFNPKTASFYYRLQKTNFDIDE